MLNVSIVNKKIKKKEYDSDLLPHLMRYCYVKYNSNNTKKVLYSVLIYDLFRIAE